jgi:hypothetical protein
MTASNSRPALDRRQGARRGLPCCVPARGLARRPARVRARRASAARSGRERPSGRRPAGPALDQEEKVLTGVLGSSAILVGRRDGRCAWYG